MRIVIDTNVLVSGIFWSGNPHKILKLWVEEKFHLLVSNVILKEYARVINELSQEQNQPTLGDKWITFITQNALVIEAPKVFHECRDPDDNKFIDCAIAGQASFLISGDKDLLDIKIVSGISIISSKNFLKGNF